MDKNNVSLPQPARAAANLLWSHRAAIWIEWETNGKRSGEKENGCCYSLNSGQCPCRELSRRGMYSIDPWWDETVTLLQGENKFWIFFVYSLSLFSFFFKLIAISHSFHYGCSIFLMCLWRWLVVSYFFIFGFERPKKRREKEREREERSRLQSPQKTLSFSLCEPETFYAQLLSVQWTMLLTPGQYGGWGHDPAGWFGFHGN